MGARRSRTSPPSSTPAATKRTTASSTDSSTPSADLLRLTVVVAPTDAERATAAACAALGTGCMEEDGPDGTVRLSLWTAPGSADPDRLRAALGAAGIAATVEAAPEDPSWQDAMRR